MKRVFVLILICTVFGCKPEVKELKKEIAELKVIAEEVERTAIRFQMMAEENAAEAIKQAGISRTKTPVKHSEMQKLLLKTLRRFKEWQKRLIRK